MSSSSSVGNTAESVSFRGSISLQLLEFDDQRLRNNLLQRRYYHASSRQGDKDREKIGTASEATETEVAKEEPVEATSAPTESPKKKKSPAKSADASVPLPAAAAAAPPSVVEGIKQYSTLDLTADAARHKAGLEDPTRPEWQNPLHHNNPDTQKIFSEDFESEEAFQAAVCPAPPVDDGSGKTVVAPAYLHELADEMVHLTMLEMNELINKIADHYGFHEGMLSPEGDDASGDGDDEDTGGGASAAPVAEKTAFDVRLVSYDASIKIKIIKEVRALVPGLGLKEAKELVEGAPVVLQKGMSKENAEQIKAKMEELGAVMEIV